MNLKDLRRNYTLGGLLESEVRPDPVEQFQVWFEQALEIERPEPNAMTLATCTPDGLPSARTVLLKSFDRNGFVFYTSYRSRKAADLSVNPRAALVLYWPNLERQVRITGLVERLEREDVESYFSTRPRGHQLGAWASEQSAVVEGREILEQNLAAVEERFGDSEIPLAPNWGGYRVRPVAIEFWQGRPNRLHDRLEYILESDQWHIYRLAP